MKSNRDRARTASGKSAALGKDIDLADYTDSAEEPSALADPSRLSSRDKKQMLQVGITLDDRDDRSGTFIQLDNTPLCSSTSQPGIEVMAISQAREKYDWLADYWWQAVAVDADKYTARVELNRANGYFIRALPGYKTIYPVQSALYLSTPRLAQNVHNIVIAEEGSELHIINGCTTSLVGQSGLHLGVSEFYIKKGARVTFTMLHSWNPEIAVRPRSGAIVEEDGLFLSNYVLMKPVRSLQMNPITRCVGERATVRYNSVIAAAKGSSLDVGSRAVLDNYRGEYYYPRLYCG